MMARAIIRAPTFSSAKPHPDFKSPSVPWLTEVWHVTHSSLPMWKTKRNLRIQYTPLPASSSAISDEHSDRIDDLVTYQSQDSEKLQVIRGIDKLAPSAGEERGEWDWRGKGWLKIASSHWEILGWGEEEGEGAGNKWMVTCFEKTMFTPAGVDLYSQSSRGIQASTLESIKEALAACEDENIATMAKDIFEVQIDDARTD